MAFDALRLRNIIQLVGILGEASVRPNNPLPGTQCFLAFHLAMMVFAALQVHQTRIALVMAPVCQNAENLAVNSSHSGLIFIWLTGFDIDL
jgi:hypothetical protein